MTLKEATRAVLERIVIQLWICAAILALLKLLGSGIAPPRPSLAAPVAGQCASPGSQELCRFSADRVLLALADKPSAGYLAACAARPPCFMPFHASSEVSLSSALDRIEAVCPEVIGPGPLLDPSNSDVCTGTPRPGALHLVQEDALTPALQVLAGPFDEQGNPIPATSRPPDLTLFPAVDIDSTLERLIRLSERFPGVPDRMGFWDGAAASGWLVFPLVGFSPGPANYSDAVQLLGRVARAVVPPPRPTPVVVDLAGLAPCPTPDELKRLIESLASLGFKAIGHSLDGTSPVHTLTEGQVVKGRILSVVVTSDSSFCPSAYSVTPGKLVSWFASQTPDPPPSGGLTVVILHWREPSLSSSTRTALVNDLMAAGASVVAGVDAGPPGPLVSGKSGLSTLNLGTLVSSVGIVPGSPRAGGVALQCYRAQSGSLTCRTVPMASSLGIGVPLLDLACPACALLPDSLLEGLYGS